MLLLTRAPPLRKASGIVRKISLMVRMGSNPHRLQKNTYHLPCLPPLHRILLPLHLSFLFNILITANFNFAVYHIDGILSPPSLDFPSRTISPTLFDFLSSPIRSLSSSSLFTTHYIKNYIVF